MVVDHGLRVDSEAEAASTCRRLAVLGISSQLLTLAQLGPALKPGAALAARARLARLGALTVAARSAGIVHLLLGHHAGDQAETLLMRQRAGSGPAGLAGMAALRETADLRILRPLLDIPAAALRRLLHERGITWTEDPSNQDPGSERVRWRRSLAGPSAAGVLALDLMVAARRAAELRTKASAEIADVLARRAMISPLGYATLSAGPIDAAALAALWQALGGEPYPPPSGAIKRLAAHPAPATLGGLRMLPAGRCGPGWLIVREQPPPRIDACDGAVWDRFVLHAADLPRGLALGALAGHAAAVRRHSNLPASLLRTLPALFDGDTLVVVPHLEVHSPGPRFTFKPLVPAAAAAFCGVC